MPINHEIWKNKSSTQVYFYKKKKSKNSMCTSAIPIIPQSRHHYLSLVSIMPWHLDVGYCLNINQMYFLYFRYYLLSFGWGTMLHFHISHSIFKYLFSSVCKIIHKIVPMLHAYLVPRYIKWHSMAYWWSLAGQFPQWPWVVAILDCTPFQISCPMGKYLLRYKYHRFITTYGTNEKLPKTISSCHF